MRSKNKNKNERNVGEDGRERMKQTRCVLVRPTSEGVVVGRRIGEKNIYKKNA